MSTVVVASDGPSDFTAHVSRPPEGVGPGVLLIPAIYGVNDEMRQIADRLAAQGFVALCPDIFWRLETGLQLSEHVEAQKQKAYELLQRFDVDLGARDLAMALSFLRRLPACSGRVGCVGYCLGGTLAFLVATSTDVDCSVSYYGVGIDKRLDLARSLPAPLMLHVGEVDPYDPPASQAAVRDFFAGNESVTIHTYAGANHAFARVGGHNYLKEAADLANSRTEAFLRQHLLSSVVAASGRR